MKCASYPPQLYPDSKVCSRGVEACVSCRRDSLRCLITYSFWGYLLSAVYRFYTAVIFHGSLLHVLFNMMALVPMGSELERIMGSVRLLYLTVLLATTNAVLHLFIAALAGYNPFYQYDHLMNECAIGFSGILFSMIVIETSLSGVTSRRLDFSMAI